MDKQNNVNKCRTCLNKSKGLQPLEKMALDDKLGDITYAAMLKAVTGININDDKNNELPQYICNCCSRKLKISHTFIIQAQEANEKLLSLLNKNVTAASEDTQRLAADCLQESQIDIHTCLEIKLESDNAENSEDNSCPMEQCEVQMKPEESRLDDQENNLNTQVKDKLATSPMEDLDSNSCSSSFQNEANYFSQSETDNKDFLAQTEETIPTASAKEQRVRKRKKLLLSDNEDAEDLSIAVTCIQCNKIFKNSIVLSRHLRNTHIPEEQKCSCPVCGVKFTRACNMFKHMRTQHDPDSIKTLLPTPEKLHQCDKCPQKYTKKKHLNNHIKAKHSNETAEAAADKSASESANVKAEERSLCSFCGCSFSKKAYLIVHMRRHTGERPFKCDLCERAFAHNSELKCHRRIHTGEKPYKCKLCEKAFRVYKKLATHMRSHTDERPYKCSQCERSFKYSKDLNIHTRVHTGERPYCCSVCGSTFTQSNSLKAHRMKLGHMDEVPQAPSQLPSSQIMHLLT